MGIDLTFRGQDVDVRLDERSITILDAATGGDPVVIPRSDVAAVEVSPGSLLGYGRLRISTRSGERHTVEFPRDANENFENLRTIIRP